ncbi:hypothetical protein WN55_05776 [Dufourea novaeangliae]|uniref:Uncharacterized protein n=1 Tax=Dufourea novaeangliae TaxID=178035 RepID=A0A154PMP5_DUFNO|nr:hypothetical protein WN55_05776 [Dufourea novaeangliae]
MVKTQGNASAKKDRLLKWEHSSPSISRPRLYFVGGGEGRRVSEAGLDSCGIVETMLECFMKD